MRVPDTPGRPHLLWSVCLSVSHELLPVSLALGAYKAFPYRIYSASDSPELKSHKPPYFHPSKGVGDLPKPTPLLPRTPQSLTHRMPLRPPPPNQRKDQSQSRASRAEGPRIRLLRIGVRRSWGREQGTHSPADTRSPHSNQGQSRPRPRWAIHPVISHSAAPRGTRPSRDRSYLVGWLGGF